MADTPAQQPGEPDFDFARKHAELTVTMAYEGAGEPWLVNLAHAYLALQRQKEVAERERIHYQTIAEKNGIALTEEMARQERLLVALIASRAQTRAAVEALRGLVTDVLEYERINNLAPNPGRKYCWDSVERAVAVLAALPKEAGE